MATTNRPNLLPTPVSEQLKKLQQQQSKILRAPR